MTAHHCTWLATTEMLKLISRNTPANRYGCKILKGRLAVTVVLLSAHYSLQAATKK